MLQFKSRLSAEMPIVGIGISITSVLRDPN